MDKQVKVDIYGTLSLPLATPQRPLVSMILLSFNQKRYIQAAIEGAFSQTYTPLEIILSDDCSTDGTFAIMEEMAQNYCGPHKVVLVRRPHNLGLIRHLNESMTIASADIFVLAAGDDISLPHRVETIVRTFVDSRGALLVHSDAIAIDADGRIGEVQKPPVPDQNAGLEAMATASAIYVGATGAIHRDLINFFGAIAEDSAFEDLVMGFRANLLGGMRHITQPLVHYRTGVGLSSFGLRETRFSELRTRYAQIMVATLRQRESDMQKIECAGKGRVLERLKKAQTNLLRIGKFHATANSSQPLAYLQTALSQGWFGLAELLRHLRFALKKRTPKLP